MTYALIFFAVIGPAAGFVACALLGAGARADAYVDQIAEESE